MKEKLINNKEFVNICKNKDIEGYDIILDWEEQFHTIKEWVELLLNTYIELELDLYKLNELDIITSNRIKIINKLMNTESFYKK